MRCSRLSSKHPAPASASSTLLLSRRQAPCSCLSSKQQGAPQGPCSSCPSGERAGPPRAGRPAAEGLTTVSCAAACPSAFSPSYKPRVSCVSTEQRGRGRERKANSSSCTRSGRRGCWHGGGVSGRRRAGCPPHPPSPAVLRQAPRRGPRWCMAELTRPSSWRRGIRPQRRRGRARTAPG